LGFQAAIAYGELAMKIQPKAVHLVVALEDSTSGSVDDAQEKS
jgi:hypothetical protein